MMDRCHRGGSYLKSPQIKIATKPTIAASWQYGQWRIGVSMMARSPTGDSVPLRPSPRIAAQQICNTFRRSMRHRHIRATSTNWDQKRGETRAKPSQTGGAMRVFALVCRVAECAAGSRATPPFLLTLSFKKCPKCRIGRDTGRNGATWVTIKHSRI